MEPLTYERFNFRLNATIDLTKNLQFFAGMGLSNSKQGQLTWEGPEGLYKKLLLWQPDQPVYTDDGRLADYGWIANVGGTVNGDGGYKKSMGLIPDIILNATYKIPFVEGLSAKAIYGQNWKYDQETEFLTNYNMYILKRSGLNRHIVHTDPESIIGVKQSAVYDKESLKKSVNWLYEYQVDFQLNYNRRFNGVHNIQAALVYEASQKEKASVYGKRENFPIYLTDQFWAAGNSRTDTDGGGDANQTTGRVSYIGQMNYSYANKYLLGFSIRRDGSMNFAPDQRWGYFPAGSLGWVISEESFFKKNIIQNLKLRASVGLTGNDAVGGWQWQESYKAGNSGYFGTSPSKSQGITYGSVVNPNLTWEKALSYNFGVDVALFKNWTTSFDYWIKNSYDILGARATKVPSSFSMNLPDENYGKLNSEGLDFSLGYSNSIKDFEYYFNMTLSYGWNKVTRKDHAENAKWVDIEEGKAIGYISGYRFDKIIRTQDELDQFNAEHPGYKIGGLSPELGMMVYKDVSGPDGKQDNSIDSWDKQVLFAKNFPIIYGLNLGFNWKGFGVDMMFNGRIKEKKSFKNLSDGVEWNRMWSNWYNDSWTEDNVNAFLPKRVSFVNSNTYSSNSDFWYKDASFIRLKYINLFYTIPTKFYNNVFDKLKIFFTGTNLFVLSKFSYYDPELDGGMSFPIMRSFNFGVDVTF